MVCTLPSQRMAALARLLMNSQTIAEDFGHPKVAVQYIHRELRDADEANLIDEKDMHIFDLRPMTDPLHLVCCNACRKPIKASQYAIHAELCSSLTSMEEFVLELDGGTGQKKPPRKDRKKLVAVYSNQTTSVGGKFDILDASDISAPESHLEAPSADAQDRPAVLDGLGNGSQNPNCLASAMPRSRKRSKTKADGPPPILDNFEAANGVITEDALPCGEHTGRSTTENQISNHRSERQSHRQLDELHMIKEDIPVPLATKIYYSHRSHCLRTAISHLYFNSTPEECHSHILHESVDVVGTLTPSDNSFSQDQNIDGMPDKEVQDLSYSAHKSDQVDAQISELYPHKSGGFPPTINISNQFSVNNALGSHNSIGKMTSN